MLSRVKKLSGPAGWIPVLLFLLLLTPALPRGDRPGGQACGAELRQQKGPVAAELFVRVEKREVRVAVRIRIKPEWHLYHEELGPPDAVGSPTRVTLAGSGITWSRVRFPQPSKLPQPGLGEKGRDTWIWSHAGTILLYARGELAAAADGSDVTARIDGLACEQTCIPIDEQLTSSGRGPDAVFAKFPADLALGAGPPSVRTTARPTPPAAADYAAVTFPEFEPRAEGASHGLVVWLLLALLAGAILNVMPCVLPVVSIKVLSFVQQAGEDRKRILGLGLAFAAGIVVVFWVLAALATLTGMGWGDQFTHEPFKIALITVVFAFSLSLFGVYEIGAPSAAGALAAGPPREGLADAFFKGVMATVLATPCLGPFMGSILAWSLAQPPTVNFLVFTMLGLGMALPYVVLTAWPVLLKLIPRPGPWLETFKHLMGFVLLATAMYLMISVRQDLLLFLNTFLVFTAMACWLWGRYGHAGRARKQRFAALTLAVLLLAAGGYFSFATLRGLFVPDQKQAEGDHVAWEDFDPERFRSYQDEGRTVFIDFTADWCPNCKYNEKAVFESPEIRALIKAKNVVALKADLTYGGPRTEMLKRLRTRLGGNAVPFLAVFPGDAPRRPHVRSAIVTIADMRKLFTACPDPEETASATDG